ncbi:flotillin 1, partial [Homo sapiens]
MGVEGTGRGGCRLGGPDGKGKGWAPVDATARLPHPQRLSLPLLQLQPEPCFSLVAQMRPWWSPDYLHSLGKARTAQVQKDARIGEAEAKRDAGIREAKAKQEKVSAQYLSEIEMAKAQRDYELKKAAYDIEVNTRRAQADLAYQL